MDRFCIQRNVEKMSGNFGYMGRSTPGTILNECGMWGDMVDISQRTVNLK